MASVTNFPGLGYNSGPTVNWTNPNNVLSSDNVYATVTLSPGYPSNSVSNYDRVDDFGFSIPATATINGIVCTVERKASSASAIRDFSVVIIKDGTPTGNDKKDTSTYWSTTEGEVSYGSPTDLWGTTWTPSNINHPDTGFAVRCEYVPAYNSATAYIDSMKMTVYYTVDGMQFGTTAISKIYYGSTEIQAIYYGSTQLA